ncbi:Pfs77 [Babesia ovis]|uniref:Pfs77 n=1 Tax=Babesia ovis TaxID=5869 RepID=A0A9W5T888_BABOV|nr:Pfs77 [Babesia ovis]
MTNIPQETTADELPKTTWVTTVPRPTPILKTCCMAREGALPITIPVYNTIYRGNQVLSGTPGILPHQQHVFTAPYGTSEQVCQGATVTQNEPVYQIQSKMFTEQQPGEADNQPVNVTHYVWTQTQTQPHQNEEPLKHQGTFANLKTLFNFDENEEAELRGDGENVQRTKKPSMCNVFSSCCMNSGHYNYGSANGSISCGNTLLRENSAVSGVTSAVHTVPPSRVVSIQNGSQRVTPQASINSQHSAHGSVCVKHGLVQENSIPITSITPQGSIVHQTSIPASTTGNCHNFMVAPSCFSTCYPRTVSNHPEAMVTMSSIPSQASIPVGATEGNCLTNCFGYNNHALTSYQTQGTFGLRNLFTMNPSGQRSVSTGTLPVNSLSRQLSGISLQPSIHEHTGVGHTAASQLLSSPPLIIQEPTAHERNKKRNLKPKTFKLHAVEIHQFVPMPTTPTSGFVQTVSGMNYTGQPIYHHNVGIQHPNAFFNPNTTGHVAPVMRDVMEGVANPKIPHMYSMDSESSHKVVRMHTEDEAKITPREDENEYADNGAGNQAN